MLFQKTLFVIVLSLCFSYQLLAQKAPIEFGKVPQEDLEMTSYDKDPDAAAVVLTNYGSARLTGFSQITTFYHKRIKILKKAAFDEADISITYYAADGFESVGRIEAQTINLKDGKTEILKVSKKEFFKEKINDTYSKISFSLPAVKEGSVIEFKYSITQESIFSMDTWYFQEDIPTRWSEFSMKVPNITEYVILSHLTKPFDDETKKNVNITLGGAMGMEGGRYRYVMKDMPAMIEEAYVTTMEDYLNKIQFQLKTIHSLYAGVPAEPVLSDWNKLAKELLESDYLGHQLSDKLKNKNVARLGVAAAAGTVDPNEKAALVFEAITKNISWNGRLRRSSSQNLNKVLEAGTGNSADINLSLIVAMRAAGFEAEPVLATTRKNGKPQRVYPIIRQFNHLIAQVTIGEKKHLIDATDPLRPYDLLPIFDLNKQALLLLKNPIWIEIDPMASSNRETVVLSLEDDVWKGKMTAVYQNYDALSIRHEIKDDGEEAYLKAQFDEESDFIAESIKFQNLDNPNERLVTEIEFSGESSPEVLHYISPILFSHWEESPFKQEKREYPIDFAYNFDRTYLLNLQLPEGYSVEETPETVAYEISGKRALFVYEVKEGPGFVQLQSKIKVNAPFFTPENYPELKLFFEKIVEKHAEQIVLKKNI